MRYFWHLRSIEKTSYVTIPFITRKTEVRFIKKFICCSDVSRHEWQDAYYLAVHFFDKYTQLTMVNLRMISIACSLLAIKFMYDEPVMSMMGHTYWNLEHYTRAQISKIEWKLVTYMRFRITIPSSFMFAEILLNKYNGYNKEKIEKKVYKTLERIINKPTLSYISPSIIATYTVFYYILRTI